MTFSFATCCRNSVLEFIKSQYKSVEITDSPESAGPLLDLVEKDICRITDPRMHGRAEVIQGKNFMGETEEIIAACKIFHKT